MGLHVRPEKTPNRCVSAMIVAMLAMLLAMLLAACSDLADPESGDELFDFAETTELTPGTAYDHYILLAERAGADFLDLDEAEDRAAELCLDGAVPSPEDWSATDTALVRAYCPELELDS